MIDFPQLFADGRLASFAGALLLCLYTPATYVRAIAGSRLAPTPLCLGLRMLHDLFAWRRARLFGFSPILAVAMAVATFAALAVLAQPIAIAPSADAVSAGSEFAHEFGAVFASGVPNGVHSAAASGSIYRHDMLAALISMWAMLLAARADSVYGVIPPFLSFLSGIAVASALIVDAWSPAALHGGAADLVMAVLIAVAIEGAVRLDAHVRGTRILGEGDAPLVFSTFAWAGPVGGALCLLAALCGVLAIAMFSRDRTELKAPLGAAIAFATMPFVLAPVSSREFLNVAIVWLV